MIVVVTGGRAFHNYELLSRTLDDIHYGPGSGPLPLIAVIRHGAAPGADALASHWAYERKVNVDAFGAKWGTHGSQAGPVRNLAMLEWEPRPDLVVAFPTKASRGTWSCVKMAEERGIPVVLADTR